MRKTDWIRQFWIKALAFALAAALVPVIAAYSIALICGYENRWWIADQPPQFYKTDIVRSQVSHEMWMTLDYYEHFGMQVANEGYFTDPEYTNYRFALYDENGASVFDNLTTDGIALDLAVPLDDGGGRIESGIAKELRAQDGIYWALWAAERLYGMYACALPALACAALALLTLVIYLACVSARRPETEQAVGGWQERIPLDLYLFVDAVCAIALAVIMDECGSYFSVMDDLPLYLALFLVLMLAAAALLLGLWMTVFARAKLGKWWRSTLTFQALRLCWRVCKWCFRVLRTVGGWALDLLRGIPLVWKTALALAGICIVELLGLASFRRNMSSLLSFWLLEKLVLIPAILWVALQLRKLEAAGAELAAGHLDAKIDTSHMYWHLKQHGENLNDISRGMRLAVEQQLKSERLKTELITNVSHDIKTPLTSILNYIDLLRRDPERAAEYLEVLDRQSKRLKKLTEDLVEVSKASTGNMAVNASRCNVRELLTQALGEYSERLEQAGLDPVLTIPELYAWADGALLWRVIDNLFSNACKYALPGTRFYVDAARSDALIQLSFKNISRERLNVTADELMERFVRGDASRSGEGSGLGLNIAQSLMELQGGSLALTVDGDLFRADLTLPAMDRAETWSSL